MNKNNFVHLLFSVATGVILGCIIGVILHFYLKHIEELSFWQQTIIAIGTGAVAGVIVILVTRWKRTKQTSKKH